MDNYRQDREKEANASTEQISDLVLQATNESIAMGPFERRQFSLIAVIGIGYPVANSAIAILVSLAAGIGSGGPVLYVCGQIVIFIVALCMATTLAEFASAMPNAAGQFYWVFKLAGGVSYIVGILAWAGSMCITASGTFLTPQMANGTHILRHPEMEYKPWMGSVAFQATNFSVFLFNLVGRLLPYFSRASMLFSATTTIIIFTTMLAASPRQTIGRVCLHKLYQCLRMERRHSRTHGCHWHQLGIFVPGCLHSLGRGDTKSRTRHPKSAVCHSPSLVS